MQAAALAKNERPRALVLLSQIYVDGGIQRFNRTFLSACDRLGVACDVLSLADTEESRSNWAAPDGASVRTFNRSKVRFAFAVFAATLRGRHDFIVIGHINLLILVAACVSFRKARGTRTLLIAHGIEVWSGLQRRVFQLALGKIDRVLSVSRYTRDRMRAQRPEFGEERYTIFPNALSESWQRPAVPTGPADLPAGLPRRYLLSVTRLARGDRYKGLTTVIEMLSMLQDTALHYVIAGKGEDQPFLQRMAQRFQLTERVHFVGAVSDGQLARLYAECAAFVLPSGKEGFGIVFLEAMYFGAPVVAAREKGAVDVVLHEQTGLLVPYGDTIALAAAVTRLLRDEPLRARLRKNGRELVNVDGPFSFHAYVGRLGDLLRLPLPAPVTGRAEALPQLAQD